jgi:hypothetical protein
MMTVRYAALDAWFVVDATGGRSMAPTQVAVPSWPAIRRVAA